MPEKEEMPIHWDELKHLKEHKASLEDIKKKFEYIEALYKECSLIEDEKIIGKMFRINVRPFKHGLLARIDRFKFVLENYLRDGMIQRLKPIIKPIIVNFIFKFKNYQNT